MRILLVGGTWTVEPQVNPETDRRSVIVDVVNKVLKYYCEDKYGSDYEVDMYNGGCYYNLETILNKAPNYDIVFWWANVPDNSLPKIRDVKEVAPHVMLVSSKRNDDNKYTFMELTQRALASKSNLVFEFKKADREVEPGKVIKMFNVRVFDPLGCVWYDYIDVTSAVDVAMNRLEYLRSITRQKTVKSTTDKNLVLAWYFDQFKQEQYQSEKVVNIPDEQKFVDIVRKHAETFYEIMNPGKHVERFLGNASLRPKMPPQVGRCSRGMPSFRSGDYVFVSQRNIDKQFIDLENFVPCYMEEGKLYYCGDNKPSVDAPIQVRLYEALPHINYIIHSHCYIEDAPFTSKSIPCGAIEEVDEVLEIVKKIDEDFDAFLQYWMNAHGKQKPENEKPICYKINLKGHGSLLMSRDVESMKHVKYIGRQLPEVMF